MRNGMPYRPRRSQRRMWSSPEPMGFAAAASSLDGLSQLLGQEMMPPRIRLLVVQPPMMGFPPFGAPSEMDLPMAPPPMEWQAPQFRALYGAPPRRVAGSVAPPRQAPPPASRAEAWYAEPRRRVVEPEYEAAESDYANRHAYEERASQDRTYEDRACEGRAYEEGPEPYRETAEQPEPRQEVRRERTAASPEAHALPCRMLSPDGGFRRVVCWGEFKRSLEGRIEHPERLRDSHRLACAIRIYEATAPFRAADLERSLRESEGRGIHLERLTADLVKKLGLAAVLPPPRRPPYVAQRQPGDVLPFERLIELDVADDPTRPQAAEPAAQAAPEHSAPASTAEAAPQRGRAAIPTRWVNPWEFRLSREEAVYDMNQELGWPSRFLRVLRRAVNMVANRTALRKWQALLNGKSADEQLWAVRPPRIALTHPRTRPWVARTLAAAGYDPATMLAEWEIFWRRKGV